MLGNDHPRTLRLVNNLAALLKAQGKLAEAEPYYREAVKSLRRVLGDDHQYTLITIDNLGSLLLAQGKLAQAESLIRKAVDGFQDLGNHQDTLKSIANLASLGSALESKGAHDEAEPLLRECLSIRQELLPGDDWRIYSAMSLLGASLLGQGMHAEAEPLLVQGYEQMTPMETLSVRKPEALVRVVRLYEDWGRSEQAAEWRKLLDG